MPELASGWARTPAALVSAILTSLIALVALLIGLTFRKRVYDQLRDAVQVMPDGLAIWDAEDRLLAWNAQFAENADADASRLRVGMPVVEFLRLIAASDPTIEVGELDAWVRDREIARRRAGAVLERKTRSGRWLRIENRRTAAGGLVAVSVDVTDFKRDAEILAQARDEAEAASRAKSDFLANMSHEIRTPMNGVMGMNSLLLRTELSPDQRRFAEVVQASAEHLLEIINDVLDISKLEAGKVKLEEVDFSLEAVVEGALELLRPRAREKSLNIAAVLDAGSRGIFRGDPGRLRQVLLNLLSNAVKFTERGFVSVEVTSRPQGADRTALRLDVHDTGVGLSAEAKSKLFQKFQQADGSSTRRFGGAGLGLCICRQLVELMGGQIGVESRHGGGSTFWFELALVNAATSVDGESAERGEQDGE